MARRPPSSKHSLAPAVEVVHRVLPSRAPVPTTASLPVVSHLRSAKSLDARVVSSVASAHQPVNSAASLSPGHAPDTVHCATPLELSAARSQSSSIAMVALDAADDRDHSIAPVW